MTEPLSWVTKRDGRLVPFEPDKISRALFRATASLGRPDAFLAHELTDGILHFLAAEAEGGLLTTAQVVEVVGKVVRELGHPALAQAYAQFARQRVEERIQPTSSAEEVGVPWPEVRRAVESGLSRGEMSRRLAGAALRTFSLGSLFTPDLATAHRDGLLLLGNLETPFALAAAVVTPTAAPLAEQIVQAGESVGACAALDAPEYVLAGASDSEWMRYARELRLGLEAAGMNAVVNLNSAVPPGWAGSLAEGPLFGDRQAPGDAEKRAAVCDALLELLLTPRTASTELRVDWHLGERDFLPDAAARLPRVVRRALEGRPVAFVFDRPRRSAALAEGLDRQNPAALLTVGLHLPTLAEQRQVRDDPAEFLQKLGSLVRMALSAGSQKREFLRRQAAARPDLAQGFRLDRARLVLVPMGLDFMARRMAKCGLAQGDAGADFGRAVLHRIREVVRLDSQSRHLGACLDGPACFPECGLGGVAGLTAWDADAPWKEQLRAGGLLHSLSGLGTAAVVLSAEKPPTVEDAVGLLHHAWRKTEVVRFRFVRAGRPRHQMEAAWAE